MSSQQQKKITCVWNGACKVMNEQVEPITGITRCVATYQLCPGAHLHHHQRAGWRRCAWIPCHGGPVAQDCEAFPLISLWPLACRGLIPSFFHLAQTSAKALTLDVGEDRLSLTAHPRLYSLDLDLPYTVDSDETGAQFNKDSKVTACYLWTASAHLLSSCLN